MQLWSRLKTIFRAQAVVAVTLAFALLPASVNAQAITAEWGADSTGNNCVYTTTTPSGEANVATIKGFQCLVANILSIAISVIGFVGFVMFLIGSFRYLLSGGNSKGIEGARNTFTFAVVGLVVALSSIIILRIIASFTGVDAILQFEIPGSDTGLPL